MVAGRLFRAANIHLVLAGLLSGAMLFAPIAYASNFSERIHASLYGSWVVLDRDMGAGVDFVTTRYLPQLPLHYPYAILGAVLFCWLLALVWLNRDDVRKQKALRLIFGLAVLHAGFGALIRFMALLHVGDGHVADSLDAGFQREYLFHFFVLYFLWRSLRNIGRNIKAGQVPDVPAVKE
ncbi:MAG TPA: hypothetical protein VHS96_00390 [Bacteroidia bacterium]|nr:hypothetical protein [Bacteroidia bacterium]